MRLYKTSLKTGTLLFVVAASLLLSGCGITAKRLHHHAGYADIESPYWWQADSELNLSLGPLAIRAARWFTSVDDEPEIKALLKDLDGLRISVYKVEDNNEIFKSNIADTQANLSADGWHPIVQVNEAEAKESTLMFMKSDGDVIDGLVVLTLSKDEAVFINIIGNIQPDSFEPLMAQVYKRK